MNRDDLWRNLVALGFKDLRVLREGSSSLVLGAKTIDNDRVINVALKCLMRESLNYQAEKSALSMVQHDGIIKVYQYLEIGKYGVLVLERLDHDLLDIIELRKLNINEAKSIFYRVCLSIQVCHNNRIAHADIKPENILASSDLGIIKLIDFGCSMSFQPGVLVHRATTGTFFYSPPEVGKNEFFPDKVDIWSLGILLHVLITSTWPFAGQTYDSAVSNASAGVIQLSHEFPTDGFGLIHEMLHLNPSKRATIEQILAHSWFEDIIRDREPIAPQQVPPEVRGSTKPRSNSPEKRTNSQSPNRRLRSVIFAPIRKILTR